VAIEFRTEKMAVGFEKYLKSGAGHAFANRHFVDNVSPPDERDLLTSARCE
jgi:hypothetical protein